MNAVDDFLPSADLPGKIGQLGWGAEPVGSGCTGYYSTTGQANHPGVFFMNSGNTPNGGCALTLSDALAGAAYPVLNLGAGGAWSYWEAQAIFETDPNGVASARYLVGFSDNNAAYHPASGNEIAVRYDAAGGGCSSNESTTNWVYEVIVGGTKSCYNSGLAVAPTLGITCAFIPPRREPSSFRLMAPIPEASPRLPLSPWRPSSST